MGIKKNQDLRDACKEKNVNFWQVAERLKIAESSLSKKMRHELSERKKREILDIIEKIGEEEKEDDE